MAQHMGPTTSVAHILWKLSVTFGTVVQKFYKVTQGNNWKVPSFATRLDSTLNQIQLQCAQRMVDLEAQQHLKDHLFNRVHKHICNSVW